MKINSKHIDEAVAKLKDLLPEDINVSEFKDASENKLKLVLEGVLQKLEMVPREEYEVQSRVLQRTRQRLEQLEQRITKLEESR